VYMGSTQSRELRVISRLVRNALSLRGRATPGYRFQRVEAFTLRVAFEDGTSEVIDSRPILHGEIYGPLKDESLFDQVRIDPEAHALVWPNGADFDPAILSWAPAAGHVSQCVANETTYRRSRRETMLWADLMTLMATRCDGLEQSGWVIANRG
jgi:hypothetical protein